MESNCGNAYLFHHENRFGQESTHNHRTGMHLRSMCERPAVLQLHKWGNSGIELNVSEFGEAFLSPTRELILLLSYQSEALLLPLVKGENIDDKDLKKPKSTKRESGVDFSPTIQISTPNSYAYVYDVNLLAWGICGDNYNQHKPASYKELLFVCGKRGVTVHAFIEPYKNSKEVNKAVLEAEKNEGTWVEWGPSIEKQEPKRWLQTFFTKVITSKIDGSIITRFPEYPSIPYSATVVSFSIFGSDFPILDVTSLDLGSYKCSALFSSNSYCLNGFVLTYQLPNHKNLESKSRKIVLVCRVVRGGIQWLYSVKLDLEDWTDFRFSNKFLICLSTAGILHFYNAITGEYVSHLDILRIYELSRPLSKFTRLLVSSYTPFLSVVDAYGVIYVISEKCDNQFSHFEHLGLGGLVNWEICGSEIGPKRIYSNIPDEYSKTSRTTRKVFIPTNKHYKDDTICFSAFGITRLIKNKDSMEKRTCRIVHSSFDLKSAFSDVYVEEAVGCIFQGCCYMVTNGGLSVILPSISISHNFFPIEAIGYRQTSITPDITVHQAGEIFEIGRLTQSWLPWKIEILDRVLLYEGPEEAEKLCFGNGWDFKMSRIRRLQLALVYLKFEEIEISLDMLAGVNMSEEGILRLIYAVVYLMSRKANSDSDVSAASRLLGLAACFATKMIRKYGLLQQKKVDLMLLGIKEEINNNNHDYNNDDNNNSSSYLPLVLQNSDHDKLVNSTRLRELAHFLEIIRTLQCRLSTQFRRPLQRSVKGALNIRDANLAQEDSELSILHIAASNQISFPTFDAESENSEKLALVPVESSNSENLSGSRRTLFSSENPKDMMSRWESDNLDQKNVVKEALLSGRLPLAVLKLHLHHVSNSMISSDKDPYDTFTEVREIGRAIAYDLFLEGQTTLAVATLQQLGEDIEACFKQLAFGTVRRNLRMQISNEMKKYKHLGPYEWNILERISLIERVYPCSSFWSTYCARKEEFKKASAISSPEELILNLLGKSSAIVCGDIDGVVLDSWTNVTQNSCFPVMDDNNIHSCYWAAAAVWSDAWDQITIDRIVLDQPFLMGVNVLWESQLEYHISHNDWTEVSKLLEAIPSYSLSRGTLQVSLDGLNSISASAGSPEFGDYMYSVQDLDSVCMIVPDVRIFRFPAHNMSSMWLRTLIEQQLAEKFIFPKEYWDGTSELISTLARSGFVTKKHEILDMDELFEDLNKPNFSSAATQAGGVQALHKVFVHHCSQYNLPNLLDIYLDHHELALTSASLTVFQDAVGENQWAKWLLLLRVKGHEYKSSFSNARTIASRNLVPNNILGVLEIDDIIRTVDDIAEGAGEIAALATLMYAPIPVQDCLSSGSVNRHSSSSAQCTLENLRPALQRFPTLWRTLLAACFGQDPTLSFLTPKPKVFGSSVLSDYLNWRDNIFFSAGHDTSLLQMLPCWFTKAVRRLVQLYVQGPLGWQSLAGLSTEDGSLFRDMEYLVSHNEHADISATTWEAAIQKHVEEELYASSREESSLGVEHHLHRGRALAALNHLISLRVKSLKMKNISRGQPGPSVSMQTNIHSDVQTLLAPISQTEQSLLLPVIPLAIVHFDDFLLVASCAFLLELCGLSASMLRIDTTALRRISFFYKSDELNKELSPQNSSVHSISHEPDITDSLARALADDYMNEDTFTLMKEMDSQSQYTTAATSAAKPPTWPLMLVLQDLEKSSLPVLANGMTTCGTWLLTGQGDGAELRSQQKAASHHWSLVTKFCRMHQIPLSTKYLSLLARDNDWVGFLSEAQVGGYSFDTVIQVASKEFKDPHLKNHMLTVLKGIQSRKRVGSSSSLEATERSETSILEENTLIPVELFGIIAECEKEKYPGEALLLKAKDLCWSLLAIVASCFPNVSPLSCLTAWLEIKIARETSYIKVNDITSQIANNVKAAVGAINSLPPGSRALTFHYNRRSPKRRKLMEEPSSSTFTAASNNDHLPKQGIINAEEVIGGVVLESSSDDVAACLSKMVAVLCEQRLFLPLLRAFEMFLPSCSLLPFIRALQAFSQMRLSEASAHLGSFSSRLKDEPSHIQSTNGRNGQVGNSWISSTASKAADAMLKSCPSPYEKRCLLQLLASTEFGDGGSAAAYYRRLCWKINLAEPSLRKDEGLHLGKETLDDASLLTVLETNGHWEQARNWARQLEATGGPWKSAVHHVTETQAESMVAEWKEFLWDVAEERVALWGHCQTLFLRYSFPPLQSGLFFLKHAEAVEKDIPARELHELLLLSLQWLSGMIAQSTPVYPLHLLREIETRVWLLAVESEAQLKNEGDLIISNSTTQIDGKTSNIIDRTANIITKMDNHINTMRSRPLDRPDSRDSNNTHHNRLPQPPDSTPANKSKRRSKGFVPSRRAVVETVDSEESNSRNEFNLQEEVFKMDSSFSRWEERVGPAELERAVLSLLEFGQVAAAKQLQHKLSPGQTLSEFVIVDAALKLAAISTPGNGVPVANLGDDVLSAIQSYNLLTNERVVDPLQILQSFRTILTEGRGRGVCKRIISVVNAANVLGLSFPEAFDKQPIELLQLLSLKAQDSFDEANLLVQTHSMPAACIAQILVESFLKGLLAAHRGGYMDSQKEEGPAPLLWRFSDFLKWADLCPSEPEIGHALMRLVITGQEIPHDCEVELLILSHHFYKSSACLDGVDVLVALAATRVDAYVAEGDFGCLARLITGVGNFHALNFILGILIENGQLDLLLQKYSAAADTNTGTAEAVRGFRMAVLTSLKQFNPNDLDAFAMVYNHFDMKHETAALHESRAEQSSQLWFLGYDKDQNEDLLESMRYYIEAAEVHSSVDAGNKTHTACAKASLVSLQIRMPDVQWLNLTETNARRALVDQSRFQEALVVALAYNLNQPGEWALVLWNQMLKPELTEHFVAEFVAVLPLQPSMLAELARFYRAEVAARGDQSQFSVWLTGGGLPAEWAKYLGRSFRCLLKRTRDLRLRLHLATIATGFADVSDACSRALDKVPENAGPLVLRKGHGGGYLPLM